MIFENKQNKEYRIHVAGRQWRRPRKGLARKSQLWEADPKSSWESLKSINLVDVYLNQLSWGKRCAVLSVNCGTMTTLHTTGARQGRPCRGHDKRVPSSGLGGQGRSRTWCPKPPISAPRSKGLPQSWLMSSWTCSWAAKGVHPSGGPWTWPTTAGCTPGGFGGLYEINNITNNIERKLVPLGAGGCLLPRSLPNPMGWWSCPSHCWKSVLRQPRLIWWLLKIKIIYHLPPGWLPPGGTEGVQGVQLHSRPNPTFLGQYVLLLWNKLHTF